jgi:hypothetical protein
MKRDPFLFHLFLGTVAVMAVTLVIALAAQGVMP